MAGAAFVVVLTVFCGTASVKETAFKCADQKCVDEIVSHARALDAVTEIRVFHGDEFSPVSLTGYNAFPPVLQEIKG